MKALKFNDTQHYTDGQLRDLESQAKNLLKCIDNYRKNQVDEYWKNVPNLEKKYIVYEESGTTYYMYVESQSFDKWCDGTNLVGICFCYDKSECQDESYFSYEGLRNFFFHNTDLIKHYADGKLKEVDKEEFVIFFKEATEWVLENGLNYIK